MQHIETHPGAESPAEAWADASAPEEETEVPRDKGAMIALMRRYAEAKEQLEEQEENGRTYVQMIQDEVKESLAPLKEDLEHARRSMEIFVSEHNGGKSFSVPALGTAYTQNRVIGRIAEPDEFLKAFERTDPEKAEALCDRKLNASRARKEAEKAFREQGEILPGADVEQVTVLCFKPSPTAAATGQRAKRSGG